MTGSSTSSSTWMLPLLLLPLFITFHHSLPFTPKNMHEFNIIVDSFGKSVMNCPENCSSVQIIDERCRCLNFSESQRECGFPGYFIEGLKSLHPNISSQETIQHLIDKLEEMGEQNLENINFCTLPVQYKPVMSPKCLHKKLEHLKEYINSNGKLTQHSESFKVDCGPISSVI